MKDMMDCAIEFASDRSGVDKEDILSKSREGRFVSARIVFAISCRKHNASLSSIAKYLHRDHTTIMHYLETATQSEIDEGMAFNYQQDVVGKPPIDISGGIFPINEFYRKVYEAYDYKCAVPDCGRDDVLEIHHIMGRKIKESNKISNLIVLCPNHHALADRGMLFIKAAKKSY